MRCRTRGRYCCRSKANDRNFYVLFSQYRCGGGGGSSMSPFPLFSYLLFFRHPAPLPFDSFTRIAGSFFPANVGERDKDGCSAYDGSMRCDAFPFFVRGRVGGHPLALWPTGELKIFFYTPSKYDTPRVSGF